jgi:hypothetical protein
MVDKYKDKAEYLEESNNLKRGSSDQESQQQLSYIDDLEMQLDQTRGNLLVKTLKCTDKE